jgi:two-component system, probable response regulator PhcQ
MTTLAFIDDEVNILYAIKRLLRKKDWNLLTYVSPEEAIFDLKGRNDVNIIISDYRMPIMDGVEMLRILKQACPNALRMILSGHADLQGILMAINHAEIYRFITKPWIDEDFTITLEKAIQFHELSQENLRLSLMVREQQERINKQLSELKRLEKESPGITQVSWSEDGSIDISDEFGDELEQNIDKLNASKH